MRTRPASAATRRASAVLMNRRTSYRFSNPDVPNNIPWGGGSPPWSPLRRASRSGPGSAGKARGAAPWPWLKWSHVA